MDIVSYSVASEALEKVNDLLSYSSVASEALSKINSILNYANGQVTINSTAGTIGGTNMANGWLRIGTTLSMDDNEIYFNTIGYVGTIGSNALILRTNGVDRVTIAGGGQVGIGKAPASYMLDVNGEINATKVYNAVYKDYAEYFLKDDTIMPGDIVSKNPDGEGYIKSREAYDKLVIGVCSDDYAQCIGGDGDKGPKENEEKYAPVGLAGRVRVNVLGKVNTGDLIVSSPMQGVGMASDGYVPGTVIGKALESHQDTGTIDRITILVMNL